MNSLRLASIILGSCLLVPASATTLSQFLPRVAIDQTSGKLAISWYDCRADGNNNLAQYFSTISEDGGVTFAANKQISVGQSSDDRDPNAFDYGDYSGLAFHGGVYYPVWADNPNSTATNPDGDDPRAVWPPLRLIFAGSV